MNLPDKAHSGRAMEKPDYQIIMVGSSLRQKGGISSVENLILKYTPESFSIGHITTHDEGSVSYRVKVFFKAILSLLSLFMQRKIDLLHVHFSERGSVFRKMLVIFIAGCFKKPILMHAHGAEFHPFFASVPQWVQKAIIASFSNIRGLITLSKLDRDLYINSLQVPGERVFVLPNPVEVPVKVPERSDRESVKLVFLGRVGLRKGAFDLIEAFAKLPAAQREKTSLILAGDGDIEQGEQLVSKLGLEGKVFFLGWIDKFQRNSLLADADIFILPSYNEGLPMAILEAMSWGLPVIATPVGGIAEVTIPGENGLLVTPGSVQQLSDAIKLAIDDKPLRLSMGQNARQTAEKFEIKTYWRSLAEIYRSMGVKQPQQYVSR
jgi:glycosyltransferase involved in cell wall biosynthesis